MIYGGCEVFFVFMWFVGVCSGRFEDRVAGCAEGMGEGEGMVG